jgi:hypothetical protein
MQNDSNTLMDTVENLFVVYEFEKKIRCGSTADGGYVIANLDIQYDCLISAGIANNDDFSVDFLQTKPIPNEHCFGFDGSVDGLPDNLLDKMRFEKKFVGSTNDAHTTNLADLLETYKHIFLKMDIEGGEWDWLSNVQTRHLSNIAQIVIEFHGVTDVSWHGITIDSFQCGKEEKMRRMKQLSSTHYLVHAHGNNADRVASNGLPNVIELVYVNKKMFPCKPNLNRQPLPGPLDRPNAISCPDIQLNFFPFVLPTNPFLLDIPDKEEYTTEDFVNIQQQLQAKQVDIERLYSPKNSFYTIPDFKQRIGRGITQTIVDVSNNFLTQKTLYTIGKGGDSCFVCCVPFLHTIQGQTTNARFVASQQILQSLQDVGFDGHLYMFFGGFPNPTGKEMKYAGVPYCFKLFMMLEAKKIGYTKVIWLDSGCYALTNPERLFAALETEEIVIKTIDSNNNYDAMSFPHTIRLLNVLTNTDLHTAKYIETIVFGLHLGSKRVQNILADYTAMVELGWPFFSIFPEEIVLSAIFQKPEYKGLLKADRISNKLQIHETKLSEEVARAEGYYFHHKNYANYETKQRYTITFDNTGGRFGNQLFRYVLCKLFTARFGHTYVPRKEFHQASCMIINEDNIQDVWNGTLPSQRHICLQGYFQKSEYYTNYRKEIMQEIFKDTNNDYWEMDNLIVYVRDYLLDSKHTIPLQPNDVVVHLRLADFLQLPCKTSDILPPEWYIEALTKRRVSQENVYIVVDAIKESWEQNYLQYFAKWKPIVLHQSLAQDIALLRDCSTLIHSNSTLCWIISFLSNKHHRIIPYTPKIDMNQNQSLRTISESDELHYVTPLDHEEVYQLDCTRRSIVPFSFCIPDECVVATIPPKTCLLASLIPGEPSTYTFDRTMEKEYNEMYRSARFALTKMKGGWDCLRHYEILMNGCIPLFENLQDCPPYTLTTYPKELDKEAHELYANWQEDEEHQTKYANLCSKYLEHTRVHCTTSATAKYFLRNIPNGDKVKHVLLITCHYGVNYNRETLWIGLQRYIQSIQGTAVEYEKMPFLYDDFDNSVPNRYYGSNCFTFPKRLQKDANYSMTEADILSKIKSKFWDLIVYGKVGPDEFCTFPYWDTVKQHYNRNKLAFLFGGDEIFDLTVQDPNHSHINMFGWRIYNKPYSDYLQYYSQFGTCFVRELNM